ncbi:hypothetical protein [Nocardioides sp.]|jgi:uncharacterized protein YukE|uniref:hypothetical protein n=1 Tax=Nocardioides sp. TaxID=35761 RepID=UPI002610EE39|nr:hypothetical protein [Nocardioides sp.]
MSFSVAEFQAVVDKINTGMEDLSAKMVEMPAAANRAIDHWYVPGFVADGVIWLCEKMLDLARQILDKIAELVRGIAAPVYFWNFRGDLEDVVRQADGVVADLSDAELAGSEAWAGRGAEAYRRQVPAQRDATAELSSMAEKLRGGLLELAIAGLVFYAGIGLVLVKFIAAMVAAIAAFGSAVFSWAGAAIVLEEAGVNTAALAGLAAAVGAVVATQARQMNELESAASSDVFPGGAWPSAHRSQWKDSSVKDGDDDWSLDG